MRNPFFDVVKLFGIVFVVLGHVCGAMHCQVLHPYLYNFRVGMNMPLFFMLSGYFAAKVIESGDWNKLGIRIIRYIWPIAVMACLFSALTNFMKVDGCENGFVGYAGRWLLFSPWFLWTLSICFCLAFACRKIASGRGFYLLVCIVYVALLFLKSGWQVHNVQCMFPFFCFGLVLRRHELWKYWFVGFGCLILYLAIVLVGGKFYEVGLSFYYVDSSWWGILESPRMLGMTGLRMLLGVAGCVGIMWGIDFLLKHVRWIGHLSTLGTTTLGVYLLHQWLLDRMPVYSSKSWCFALTFVLVILCHALSYYSMKIGCLKKLIWCHFEQNMVK